VAVIGAGFGAKVHIPSFQRNPNCEVAAVCASKDEHARVVARQNKIKQFSGRWQDFIRNPGIDIVSIAVPPALQPKIAVAALENGKHVFCEKPLSVSVKDAKRMALAAKKSGLANMADFEFPEIAHWQKAKEVFGNGEIGNLRHISVVWNVETYANKMGIASWKTRFEEGGGALLAFVSHVFYYLEWMCGKIERLSAHLARFKNAPGTGDTLVSLQLMLESSVPVSVLVSTHSFLGNGHRLEFYGDKGTLILDNSSMDYVNGFRLFKGARGVGKFKEMQIKSKKVPVSDGRIVAVSSLVNRLVGWIETKKRQSPNFSDGVRVQDLIELAKKSHKMRSWVSCR